METNMETIVETKLKNGLYLVATPIGNLGDISSRAIHVLRTVSLIAAEDTRHSQKLLKQFNIQTPLFSLHEHNERDKTDVLLNRILRGESVALISDAGTPLISDPGYFIVKMAHQQNIPVIPIPGPSALITALCASGLPTDRFIFEGFLPAKSTQRQAILKSLVEEERTLIFYESPHRIVETLKDMVLIFGDERVSTLAREMTKTFETIRQGSLKTQLKAMAENVNETKGEFVILIQGKEKMALSMTPDAKRIFEILNDELGASKAARLAAKITNMSRNEFYEYGLHLKE